MTKIRVKTIAGAALAASALFALTAPGASAAAAVKMPRVLDGFSDTQAIKVTLKVPSIPQLRAAMLAAGLPVDALPAVDVSEPLVKVIEIATNHGEAVRSVDDNDRISTKASGFSLPLRDGATTAGLTATHCKAATCTGEDANATKAAQRIELPAALGHVDVAGASSRTLTHLSTDQRTAAIDLNVSLESVLATEALGALRTALGTLTTQLNSTVVPQLNSTIDTVKTTVDGVAALAPLKEELDRVITIDHVKPIANLSEVSLLTGRVLSGSSTIATKDAGGMTGLLSTSESEIVNLELLDGWASVGSIKVAAEAFANSVKGLNTAKATSEMDVANVDLGGLLGIHLSADDLIHLTQSATLKNLVKDTAEAAGVKQDLTQIENAIELVYDTAGISVVRLDNTNRENIGRSGALSEATANSMMIQIAPKFPNVAKLQSGLASGTIPALADSDYVPTGLSLTVELPRAEAVVRATSVQSICVGSCVPITGLGTPWMVALSMIGLAILVRKFALAR